LALEDLKNAATSFGGQEPRSPLVEDRAGQPPCHESAGVDIDPVREDVGRLGRSVAVHDDLAEVGAAGEELFSNPQEVLLALAIQRHAGADTGMAHEVPARRQRHRQRSQELQVSRRDGGAQVFGGLLVIPAHHQGCD